MTWIWQVSVIVALAGCSKREAQPAGDTKPLDPSMVAVPKPVPPGPYVVAYDCFHSNQPFGEGSWSKSSSADLGAMQWTWLEVTRTTDDPQPNEPPPPQPTTAPVSAASAATLNAAIAKIFAGGPYKNEYAVPEGTPCTLSITAGGKKVFQIDKAFTNEKDAVNDLVRTFGSLVGS